MGNLNIMKVHLYWYLIININTEILGDDESPKFSLESLPPTQYAIGNYLFTLNYKNNATLFKINPITDYVRIRKGAILNLMKDM